MTLVKIIILDCFKSMLEISDLRHQIMSFIHQQVTNHTTSSFVAQHISLENVARNYYNSHKVAPLLTVA